ncbi:MAG: hypothetical protein ACREC0_09805 [Methylocella sp.]
MKSNRTVGKTVLASSVFLGMAFGAAANAMAASPVGQWTVTFYSEPALAQTATQGICYLANGTWFSTTFSNWNGDWFQKGDRFRWYGKTSSALATAFFGGFISNTSFSGECATFRSSGSPPVTSNRGNYAAVFVSRICGKPAAASAIVIPNADPSGK